MRGYFAIGIENPKKSCNIGTLFRSAASMGASYIFTIGKRYQHQNSDTCKSYRHIPLFHYDSVEEFINSVPKDCHLIGVELDAFSFPLTGFCHPERAIYLLGAEDKGLSEEVTRYCERIVEILYCSHCLNVSVAGSIVMYDRVRKANE